MNSVYIALVVVSVLAAGLLVALVVEETNRREWKRHDAALERRVAVDEALLAELRGPRPGVDANDPWRAV
jgi:hypothetical protein